MQPRFLRLRQIQSQYLDVSQSTLYRWIKNGTFVQPRKLGNRCVVFDSAELMAWLDSKGIPPRIPVGV
jgi:excisionase family DNA binding protein